MRSEYAAARPGAVSEARDRSQVALQGVVLGVVVAALAIGLLLRFVCIDCRGLWYDEIASVETAQRGITAILTDRFGWMLVQPPLHYLLVWLTTLPADPAGAATWVRLPSTLAGVGTIWLVYLLGRDRFGKPQGALAALLLALAPVHIAFSNEARPYALLTFLVCASVYLLGRAEQDGGAGSRIAFTAVAAFTLLSAYHAVTLAAPPLAVYYLWAGWRHWRSPAGKRTLTYWALAGAALVILAIPGALEILKVPRQSPDLSRLSLGAFASVVPEMLAWFTPAGWAGDSGRVLPLLLLLVGLYGLYAAYKEGGSARGFAGLCVLMIVIPALLLLLFSTTNPVFQRYALFSFPFYLLLIANGALAPATALAGRVGVSVSRAAGLVLAGLVIVLFASSAIYYTDPARQQEILYRPDFRSTAAYLSRHATPNDLVVFIMGDVEVNFFWKGTTPSPAYSALDPRVFAARPAGSIYWVLGYKNDLPALARDPRWASVTNFDHVAIMQESPALGDFAADFDRIARALEKTDPYDDFVNRIAVQMEGGVMQARGQASQAVDAYRRAGVFFGAMAVEYLRTAEEWESRGDHRRAIRDALIAKSMGSQDPDLHRLLSVLLDAEGHGDYARVEREMATLLTEGQK